VRPCINIDSVTTRSGETYKFNLSYKLRDDKLLYGTLSTGFRPGGVNRVRNRPAYTPDYLTNLEFGWKTTWHDGALRFNGAAFLERWKDAQFGFTGANGITEITNAGKAEIRGLEADLQWAVSRNFMLSGSLTVLRSKLLQNACRYPSPSFSCTEPSLSGAIDTTPLAVAGSRLPVSPRMKANLVGRFHFPFRSTEAHVQGALVAQSNVIPGLETAANVATGNQPGYVTFDLAAGIERGNWTAELYIDNFFDRRAEQSRFTPCNPDYCSQVYVIPVRPRLAGLTFSQKF
jgi:outer membrane receptor protein involved in Fe transport